MPSSTILSLIQGLSLNPELTDSARLTGRKLQGSSQSHRPTSLQLCVADTHYCAWLFKIGAGDLNSDPRLRSWQLSHLPSPEFLLLLLEAY